MNNVYLNDIKITKSSTQNLGNDWIKIIHGQPVYNYEVISEQMDYASPMNFVAHVLCLTQYSLFRPYCDHNVNDIFISFSLCSSLYNQGAFQILLTFTIVLGNTEVSLLFPLLRWLSRMDLETWAPASKRNILHVCILTGKTTNLDRFSERTSFQISGPCLRPGRQ